MDYRTTIEFVKGLYPNRDIIPLHEPYFGGKEKNYLLDCIDSTYVSSVGKYVDQFEYLIRDFTGAKHAIATVNGTAALHVALKLAGVESGDLVITQPLTFVATCNAISYCGAEPVFVDIDRQTLGLSADALESWLVANTIVKDGQCYFSGVHELNELSRRKDKVRKSSDNLPLDNIVNSETLTPGISGATQFVPISEIRGHTRIAACIPMHTFGHPCEIDRIVEICDRYNIPVVEDSAESIGSYYKGEHTGTFGKLGILSFNGNKTITTGGGGMILTNEEELGKLAKHITTTAKIPHPWRFEHDMIGYNYRLPNINAALGCAQMEILPELLKSKRDTAQKYQKFFQSLIDIEFVQEPEECISNYWLCSILLNDLEERDDFLKYANDNKIMSRPAWTLMNNLPMFRNSIKGDLPISEEIANRLVNIPSSPK